MTREREGNRRCAGPSELFLYALIKVDKDLTDLAFLSTNGIRKRETVRALSVTINADKSATRISNKTSEII